MTLSTNASRSSLVDALPVMLAVFLTFATIGLALPVLPLHIHEELNFGPFVVGVVAGSQFVASFVSRLWAGRLADTRGPKHAIILGFAASIAGGLLYWASLGAPSASVAIIFVFLGRTLVGGAESLVITGGILWGPGLAPRDRTGNMIAWMGMAMFAGMALGAPIGSVIYAQFGFLSIAVATVAISMVPLAFVLPMKPWRPPVREATSLRSVLSAVALPGIAFALSGITFGAITAFLVLLFARNGWPFGALAFIVRDFVDCDSRYDRPPS